MTHLAAGAEPAVTFHGAAQTVAGSMHLVEAAGRRILLDCGKARIGRGRGPEVDFPFLPTSLDAVILSHAHIDHCGNLPYLVRQGYDGPIYCTAQTRELMALMLGDSARIQDQDDHVRRLIDEELEDSSAPRSATSWVRQLAEQCVALEYGAPMLIAGDIGLRLVDAGHILGSSMVHLTLPSAKRERTFTFTGDIGRRGLPFLLDASPVPPADLVISESTYGGRFHQSVASMAEALARVVRRSADEGGVTLIPAFSLGRTQLVVHYLCQWRAEGLLPDMPIYADSPLAADIAEVYARHPDRFAQPPLGNDGSVTYVRSAEESDALSCQREPCVIVASGGMCEGGRIVKYLRRYIDDPRASLALVSYQAPDTLGRRLLERCAHVWFQGKRWNKWIDVVELGGFSGHADHADLLAFLGPLARRPCKLRLVHGEPEAMKKLANALRDAGFADVAAPTKGERVEI